METIMLGQLGRFCVVQVTGRIILGLSVNKVIIIIIQVSWPTCLEKKNIDHWGKEICVTFGLPTWKKKQCNKCSVTFPVRFFSLK